VPNTHRIVINMPDPDREHGPDPGPVSKHLWANGRLYDKATADRLALDLVERGIVRNAGAEEVL
jgi:hypothetical protein